MGDKLIQDILYGSSDDEEFDGFYMLSMCSF